MPLSSSSATAGKTPAIDAELKPLEKKLKKPPFSSWNEFHKLSSGEFPLVRLKSEPLKLKEGAASVLLRDRSEKRIERNRTARFKEGMA